MITAIGKELRKLRIDHNERLLDMAERLGKSASFLSAIEVGKKNPPSGFEEAVAQVYRLSGAIADRLRAAADQSRHAFTLEPKSPFGRETAGLLARRIDGLSESQLKEIRRIVSSDKGGGG
jgi:transcriptional regulator with XRE-family HTH domain